ncbi:MAG: O-antigen ligase family protein [Chitinophagaceae bacterium]|nr:O-antigen ligase family protein [Chitinophagaceae bacterium]
MAKKHKKRVPETESVTPSAQVSRPMTSQLPTWIATFFILLYLLVEFIPNLGSYDTMGPQWFYLAVVDMVCLSYLLYAHQEFESAVKRLFSFPFTYLLLAFLTWATISVTWAFNTTETWVCIARLLTTVVAFFNLFLLIDQKKDVLNVLAYLLAGILLLQSIQSLSFLFSQMGSMSFNEIVLGMRGNAGNKNIYAASLMIKIPFALYGIIQLAGIRKLFFLTSFTLGSLVIFLLNSRTTYLGLIAVIVLTVIYELIRFFRDRNKEHWLKFIFLLLPLAVSYLIGQGLVNSSKYNVGDENTEGGYGTVVERMGSIVSEKDNSRNQRLAFWQHAIDYTKSHPFLGSGYGNWKLESIEPSKDIFDELSVPLHAHNDFLEFFAELGIPGGLLYISLFITIALITIRTIIQGNNKETEPILVMAAIGLLAYAIDAFFNFPIERSINQIFFSLVSAVCLASYIPNRIAPEDTNQLPAGKQGNKTLLMTFSLLLIMLPVAYVTFQTYQSLIIQEKTRIDMDKENINLTPEYVISAFPSMPNIGYSTLPIDGIKARYLGQNGKMEDAMKYVNRIQYTNPHLKYGEFLKALIYINSNRPDSAQKYAAEAFFHRPRVKNYYDLLIASSVQMKDTNTIKKAFNLFISKRPELPGTWDRFLEGMTNVKVSYQPSAMSSQLLQLADSALKIFPGDTTLLKRKFIILKNL